MDQDLRNAIDEAFCARSEALFAGDDNTDAAQAFLTSLWHSGYTVVANANLLGSDRAALGKVEGEWK
jgi:hypothetical protein